MKGADTTIFGNAAETRDDFKELIEQLNESTKTLLKYAKTLLDVAIGNPRIFSMIYSKIK